MSAAAVRIAVRAELQGLRKDLQGAGNLTAAEIRKMVAATRRQIKELETAAKEAAAASKTAASGAAMAGKGASDGFNAARASATNLQAQIFDIGTSLQGGMNPLTILAQQGPQVAQALAGSANAAATLKAALASTVTVVGPVAAAVGGAYLAWQTYTEEARNADEINARIRTGFEDLEPLIRDTERATIDLAVATGELSEAEGDRLKNARRALDTYNQSTASTREQLAEVRKQQQGWTTALTDTVDKLAEWSPGAMVLSWAIDGVTKSSAELEAEAAGLQQTLTAGVGALDANVDRTNKLADANDRNARATKASTEAERERERAAKELARALEQVREAGREAYEAGLDDIGKINAARDAELTKITDIADAYKDNAEVQQQAAAAFIAVNQQADDEVEAIRDARAEAEAERLRKEAEDAKRSADAKAKAEQAAAEASKQAWLNAQGIIGGAIQQGLGLLGDVASDTASSAADTVARLQGQMAAGEDIYTAAQEEALAKRIAAQKDAARKAFNVAKEAKRAEAAAATALAVINAIASAPPPFGFIAGGVALAAGLAAQAQISKQQVTFHRGGPIKTYGGMASDETMVRARDNEYILSPQGRRTIGDDTLSRANAGAPPSGGGGDVWVVQAYKHNRMVTRYKRDGLRRGDPIAQAIYSTTTLGHRS